MKKRFWVSWYSTEEMGDFNLESPWWSTKWHVSDDAHTIVAALLADDEEDAKRQILAAYHKEPESVEWRFCAEKEADFTPFCDRFQRADWMQWPEA